MFFALPLGLRFDAIAQSQTPTLVQGKPMTYFSDTRSLMAGLAMIESGNDPKAIGDRLCLDGPAIGSYQIHQSAWDDISAMRRKMGLSVHPYHAAFEEQVARAYALTFISEIVKEFEINYNAPPNPTLLYACYSLGPSIIPKIRRMKGLTITTGNFQPKVTAPAFRQTNIPLTSVGYSASLASRKMATGKRYMNLLDAHHQSILDTGIPLLWK